MKIPLILMGLVAIATAGSASASHLVNNNTPFASRGACESFTAEGIPPERERLLENFPNFFNSYGDVASFLTRAWTCELNEEDGQWYIEDHRFDVLNSDWYQDRH